MKRKISVLITAVFCAAILFSCGVDSQLPANTNEPDTYAKEYAQDGYADFETGDYMEDMEEAADNIEASTAGGGADEQKENKAEFDKEKIIYNASMEIETQEYEKTKKQLYKVVEDCGGFLEREYEADGEGLWSGSGQSRMSLELTVRVPIENYEKFKTAAGGTGQLKSMTSDAANVTQEYNDLTSRIKSLEKEEERLLAMMEQAQSIDDMISVEDRLTEVQTELNGYETQRRNMDTDISYSTVSITLNEVVRLSPQEESAFGTRMSEAFSNAFTGFAEFLKLLLIGLVYLFPYAILVLVVLLVVFVIIKCRRRKAEKRIEMATDKIENSNKNMSDPEKNIQNKK